MNIYIYILTKKLVWASLGLRNHSLLYKTLIKNSMGVQAI